MPSPHEFKLKFDNSSTATQINPGIAREHCQGGKLKTWRVKKRWVGVRWGLASLTGWV